MTFAMTMRNLLDLGLLRAGLMRRPSRLKVASGLVVAGAAGALAGAGAALLLAPAEGKKTRAKLTRGLKEALPHLGNGVGHEEPGRAKRAEVAAS